MLATTGSPANHVFPPGADGCVYPSVVIGPHRYQIDHSGIRWRWSDWRERPRRSEVSAAIAWLRERAVPIKTLQLGAYAVKHAAESWAGQYISTGALILAAAHLGVPMRVESSGRVLLALSRPAYRSLPEVTASAEAAA